MAMDGITNSAAAGRDNAIKSSAEVTKAALTALTPQSNNSTSNNADSSRLKRERIVLKASDHGIKANFY